MTWTRLDDSHFDRAERLSLSRDALLLEVEALVWCNRTGTDGAITMQALKRMTTAEEPTRAAHELQEAGLWQATAEGYQVVGWADQQPTAAEVQRRKAETRERVDRHRRHTAGDHTRCTPGRCKSLPAPTDVTRYETRTNGVSNGPPTRPDPTRPDPQGGEGRGEGQSAASSAAASLPEGRSAGASEPREGTTRVTFRRPRVQGGAPA